MKAVTAHKGEVYCACALPGSTGLVATAGHDGNVALWENGRRSKKFSSSHDHLIRCLAACVYGDEVYFVTASWDSTLKVFTSTGVLVCTLQGHTNRVKALTIHSFSPSDASRTPLVVSGGDDHTIRVWDLLSGECLQSLHDAHNHFILALCTFPRGGGEGLALASASSDKTIKLWDFPSCSPLLVLDECDDVVTCMLYCPFSGEEEVEGGREGGGVREREREGFIVCGTTGGAIKIWTTTGPSLLHSILHAHTGRITALCQPSHCPGDVVLSVGVDGRLASWGMLEGAQGSIGLDVALGDGVELLACCCSPHPQPQPEPQPQPQPEPQPQPQPEAQAQVREGEADQAQGAEPSPEHERGALSPDPIKAYGLLTEDLYLCTSDGRVLVLELATVTSPSTSSHGAGGRHFLSAPPDKEGRGRWDVEGEPQSPTSIAASSPPVAMPSVNVVVAARPTKPSAPSSSLAPSARLVKLPQIVKQPAAARRPIMAAASAAGRAPIAILAEDDEKDKDEEEEEASLPSAEARARGQLLGLAATGSRKQPSSKDSRALPRRRSPPIVKPPASGSVAGSGLYQMAREESAVVEEVAHAALLLQAALSSTRTSKLGRSPLSAAMKKIIKN